MTIIYEIMLLFQDSVKAVLFQFSFSWLSVFGAKVQLNIYGHWGGALGGYPLEGPKIRHPPEGAEQL